MTWNSSSRRPGRGAKSELIQNRIMSHDAFRRAQAVDGGADDAARVAGALADRVQPFDSRTGSSDVIADDAHRGAAAGFWADQSSIPQESSLPPVVQDRQAVMGRLPNHRRGSVRDC